MTATARANAQELPVQAVAQRAKRSRNRMPVKYDRARTAKCRGQKVSCVIVSRSPSRHLGASRNLRSVQDALTIRADVDFRLLARCVSTLEPEGHGRRPPDLVDRLGPLRLEVRHVGLQHVEDDARDL